VGALAVEGLVAPVFAALAVQLGECCGHRFFAGVIKRGEHRFQVGQAHEAGELRSQVPGGDGHEHGPFTELEGAELP
jgi:hypothetical protein